MASIDIDILRDILDSAESMAAYYDKDAARAGQNEALVAAGFAPIHDERSIKRAVEMAAKERQRAEVLRHVIAYHSGTIYQPGEVAA